MNPSIRRSVSRSLARPDSQTVSQSGRQSEKQQQCQFLNRYEASFFLDSKKRLSSVERRPAGWSINQTAHPVDELETMVALLRNHKTDTEQLDVDSCADFVEKSIDHSRELVSNHLTSGNFCLRRMLNQPGWSRRLPARPSFSLLSVR